MNAWLPRTRIQWLALAVGLLALAGCLWLGTLSARQALLSYLFAFVFFTGLSVGGLAMAMVHALTGGAWGYYIRAPLLAAARVLPLQALLALPVLLGMPLLYPWAEAGARARDSLLQQQAWYLDPTFFVLRTVAYFVVWMVLATLFVRRLEQPWRLPRVAAPGLIVFAVTSLLAATDWTMSLLPHWHASSYGMMVATGWMLTATALAALYAVHRPGRFDAHPPQLLHDLGNLLLMFVLGWSYLAFMQYLTIWIADLPTENGWYIPRTLTSWRWLAWFLIAFHFALPFALLLSRAAKRRRAWLGPVAAMLLLAGLADALWLVVPNFRSSGFMLHWSDLLAPLGIGALWWCAWCGQLRAVGPAQAAPTMVAQAERGHG